MEYPNVLAIAGSLIYLYKSIDFIYLFQIKEYRFDRFMSFIREEGIAKALFFHTFKLPAKSFRNLILFVFHVCVTIILYVAMQQISIIFVLFSPLIAIAATFIAIGLTNIASFIFRFSIIYIAKQKIKSSGAVFIGITGSFGKTSVKEFLHDILSKKYVVASTFKNYNSDIGIALSVLRLLKKNTQFFIAEMGAYRVGEIAKCCQLVNPLYGILTGIGNQHLDLFGSRSNLIQSKFELLKALPKKGKAYINIDAFLPEAQKIGIASSVSYYSIKKPADISAREISYLNHHLQAKASYKKMEFAIDTPILGSHTVTNLLPCIALAYDLGVSKKDIEESIQELNPVPHRLSLNHGVNGSTILDDSYSSNVDGFIAAINVTDSLQFDKKIILTRGLIELGIEKRDSYAKIIEATRKASSQIDLYTTDPLFGEAGGNGHVNTFGTEDELINALKIVSDKKTLIIIEGRFSPKTVSMIY